MPTELPFVTLDVFTATPYRGNPLAVVTIPPTLSPPPTQAQKQAIAREFNLSETVFVHDVADPSAAKTRTIDIFLPSAEIPFAGHPTIGTAVSLLGQGVDTLLTKAGPVPLELTGERFVQASIPHDVHLHAKTARQLRPSELYSAERLQADKDLRERELSSPVVSIVNGVTFLLVELESLEQLAKVQQTGVGFPPEELLDDGWRRGLIARLYYVKMGERRDEESGLPVQMLRTRMMEHLFEDPATGSAACCLGSYLSIEADKGQTGMPKRRYDITQGVEMGKESDIVVEVEMKNNRVDHVRLAGTAVQVMRGYVSL
ncbi:Phenazine biosynthesis PhzC/PhzF protein [Metarhizium album ARSEF 1941]|uniref:Phenazine biosynthesis PhzC/PhzF protein n=1 Tax=Metarhizium album (strain ARSEF 1941) TaxID=1081103 RepID=A0A0B2X7G8_METAS|nr:Phenazine biosynthesis PhzC/PhzF protein [Metarhizium album ARSEF 1941]KHO01698.1 Phenazine biosynthesis PhzC/PhzF protein [Metarhizium album ARSEF 1941]